MAEVSDVQKGLFVVASEFERLGTAMKNAFKDEGESMYLDFVNNIKRKLNDMEEELTDGI